jgi:hypothetical protein
MTSVLRKRILRWIAAICIMPCSLAEASAPIVCPGQRKLYADQLRSELFGKRLYIDREKIGYEFEKSGTVRIVGKETPSYVPYNLVHSTILVLLSANATMSLDIYKCPGGQIITYSSVPQRYSVTSPAFITKR